MPYTLTAQAVATRCAVTRHTIYAWIKAGTMPPVCYRMMAGTRYRFDPEAIETWISGNLAAAPSAPSADGSGPRQEGPVAGQGA